MSDEQAVLLAKLAEHSSAAAKHQAAQTTLIWEALESGCSLVDVAKAAGLQYDQLRMRVRRRRQAMAQ